MRGRDALSDPVGVQCNDASQMSSACAKLTPFFHGLMTDVCSSDRCYSTNTSEEKKDTPPLRITVQATIQH